MYAVWEMKKTHDTYVVLAATETSPGCAKLNGMHKDADRIKSLLPSDIPDSNIIVLKNSDCTTENLKKHLEIGKDYKLLVYLFSDHGSSKNNGDMCTYNGRFNSADFYKIVS